MRCNRLFHYLALFLMLFFILFPYSVSADGDANAISQADSGLAVSLELGDQGKIRTSVGVPVHFTITNQSPAEFRGTLSLITPFSESEQTRKQHTQFWNLLTSDELAADTLQDGRNCVFDTDWQITVPPMETVSIYSYITIPEDANSLNTIITDQNGQTVLVTNHPIPMASVNENLLYLAAFPEDPKLTGLNEGMRVYFNNQSQKVHVVKLTPDSCKERLDRIEPDALFLSSTYYSSLTEEEQQVIRNWELGSGAVFVEDEITSEVIRNCVQDSATLHRITQTSNSGLTRYQAFSFLSNLDSAKTMQFSLVLTILLVFTLLAGPGLWFLLRRLDKLKLHWNLLALISLVVIALFITTSLFFKDSAPSLQYLETIVQGTDGSVKDNILFSLRTPYQDPVTLYVEPDVQIHPMLYGKDAQKDYFQGSVSSYSEAEQINMSYLTDRIEISIEKQSAYSEEYFELTKTISNTDQCLTAQVQLNGMKACLIVSNQTEYAFSDAVLLTPAGYYRIGEIGQQMEISPEWLELHDYHDTEELSDEMQSCIRDWKNSHLMNSEQDFILIGQIDEYVPDYWMHSGYVRNGVSFYLAHAELTANQLGWCDSNWAGAYFENPMESSSYRKTQDVNGLVLRDQQTEIIYHLEDAFDETTELKAFLFAEPLNQDQPFQGTFEVFNYQTENYDPYELTDSERWISLDDYIRDGQMKVRFIREDEREGAYGYAPILIIRERGNS